MKNVFLFLTISLFGAILFSSCEKEAIQVAPPTAEENFTRAKIYVTLAAHNANGDCTDGESLAFTDVFLFRSDAERAANSVFKQGKTSVDGQLTFHQMEEGEYFIQATYEGQTVHDAVLIQGNVRTAYLDLLFDNGES